MGSDSFTLLDSVFFWPAMIVCLFSLFVGAYKDLVGGKDGLEDVRERGRPELWPFE